MITTVHRDRSTATFDDGGAYRYRLTRRWGTSAPISWVLLNPSTATARQDDPTIRRVVGFSRSWGFGSMLVVNLFALCATTPAAIRAHPDPVGPDNDAMISQAIRLSRVVVVAWGVSGATMNPVSGRRRNLEVIELLAGSRLICLGNTANGQPRHPLYMARSTRPVPFQPDPAVLDAPIRGLRVQSRPAPEISV